MNKIYNIKEAAMALGVSPMTIRRFMKEGNLKGEIKSNKHGYKFYHDDLVECAKKLGKRFVDIGTIQSTDKLCVIEQFVTDRLALIQSQIAEEYLKNKNVREGITSQYSLLLEIQEILKSTT